MRSLAAVSAVHERPLPTHFASLVAAACVAAAGSAWLAAGRRRPFDLPPSGLRAGVRVPLGRIAPRLRRNRTARR